MELLELCRQVRNLGIEVVVVLGHAEVSVLDISGSVDPTLTLGIVEVTTPTARAVWIPQEHVNSALIDNAQTYKQ